MQPSSTSTILASHGVVTIFGLLFTSRNKLLVEFSPSYHLEDRGSGGRHGKDPCRLLHITGVRIFDISHSGTKKKYKPLNGKEAKVVALGSDANSNNTAMKMAA